MSITSLEAAKFLCDFSEWNIKRNDIHKLLYLAGVLFIGEHGEPLIKSSFPMFDLHRLKTIQITNEYFVASCQGPLLRGLDKRISIFGSRKIKNIFNGDISVNNKSHPKEVEILEYIYTSMKDKPQKEYVSMTMCQDAAWIKRYTRNRLTFISNEDMLNEYNTRFRIKG